MNHRAYCTLSGVLFALVAAAHLGRIIFGLPVQVGELRVPMVVSWIGLIVPAGLALWAFRLARSARPT